MIVLRGFCRQNALSPTDVKYRKTTRASPRIVDFVLFLPDPVLFVSPPGQRHPGLTVFDALLVIRRLSEK